MVFYVEGGDHGCSPWIRQQGKATSIVEVSVPAQVHGLPQGQRPSQCLSLQLWPLLMLQQGEEATGRRLWSAPSLMSLHKHY